MQVMSAPPRPPRSTPPRGGAALTIAEALRDLAVQLLGPQATRSLGARTDTLQASLASYIRTRRVLVVLDDVWDFAVPIARLLLSEPALPSLPPAAMLIAAGIISMLVGVKACQPENRSIAGKVTT